MLGMQATQGMLNGPEHSILVQKKRTGEWNLEINSKGISWFYNLVCMMFNESILA